jgi:hypothetical protein
MTAGALAPVLVGSYPEGEGRAFLPASGAELSRSQLMIERIIESFDFTHGQFILLISLLEQGAHAIAFERAIMAKGLLATNADDSPYEATRIESICRRFDIAAIIGVSSSVLDGLAEAGHEFQTIFGNRVVWAYPGAYERLEKVPGVSLRRCLELGPAFGIECVEGAGCHIDGTEWRCEEREGDILLSSRLLRATDFADYRTGVKGSLLSSPCACGSSDVRITVA